MQHNPVVWFEIYVQDMDRAVAFYEAVFQVRLSDLPAPKAELQMKVFPGGPNTPGAAGALVKVDQVPSGGNSTLVYFHCEDCAQEARRAADSGGEVLHEKFSIGEHGFVAHVKDPDGNLIGLHSQG